MVKYVEAILKTNLSSLVRERNQLIKQKIRLSNELNEVVKDLDTVMNRMDLIENELKEIPKMTIDEIGDELVKRLKDFKVIG